MMDALNRMIEQREAGEDLDPSFERSWRTTATSSPATRRPSTSCSRSSRPRWRRSRPILDSMSPEQRAQLQALAASLFEDMDLRWQMDRLAENLRQARARRRAGAGATGTGRRPDGPGRRGGLGPARSARWTSSSSSCARPPPPARWPRSTSTRCAKYLGEDGARSLEAPGPTGQAARGGRAHRAARGPLRADRPGHPRASASRRSPTCSPSCAKDRLGGHRNTYVGTGHEPEGQTKPYEFGDPFTLDIQRTVHNAVRARARAPRCSLEPDDFEISRTEHVTRAVDGARWSTCRCRCRCATTSWPPRRWPSRCTRSSRPSSRVTSSGSSASPRWRARSSRRSSPRCRGTSSTAPTCNTALMLARRMLAHRAGTKQIIMITDGEPTAHLVPDHGGGYEVFFHYPPTAETVRVTLAEVVRCTQGRDHHQHVHARRQPLAAGIRRADDEAQPGPGVLHHARDARRLRPRRLPRAPPHRSFGHSPRRLALSLSHYGGALGRTPCG